MTTAYIGVLHPTGALDLAINFHMFQVLTVKRIDVWRSGNLFEVDSYRYRALLACGDSVLPYTNQLSLYER